MSTMEAKQSELRVKDPYRERVEKGAALLDEVKPGWAKMINLKVFCISSRCDCILGQLYTRFYTRRDLVTGKRTQDIIAFGYDAAKVRLKMSDDRAAELGFTTYERAVWRYFGDNEAASIAEMNQAQREDLAQANRVDEEFKQLDRAWRQLIEERRAFNG